MQTQLQAEDARTREANALASTLAAEASEARAQLEAKTGELANACTELEQRELVVAALEKAVIEKDAASAQLHDDTFARAQQIRELGEALERQAEASDQAQFKQLPITEPHG